MASRRSISGALEATNVYTPAGTTAVTAGIAPIWIDNRSEQIEQLEFNLSATHFGSAGAASTPTIIGASVFMVLVQNSEFTGRAAANTPALTVSGTNLAASDLWPPFISPTVSYAAAYTNAGLQSFYAGFPSLVFGIHMAPASSFRIDVLKIPAKQRSAFLVIGISPFISNYVQATTDGTTIMHLGFNGVMYEP